VHEAIKAGLPERDRYIEAYIATLEALGEEGVDLVCYNFMPVFDWTRTSLAKPREDGATVLAYDQEAIDRIEPDAMFDAVKAASGGFVLPGWEPERLARIRELFVLYRGVDAGTLFSNLVYFLEALMPTCRRYGMKMAIHPDDPAWPVFGLPRIVNSKEGLLRLMKAVDDPHNGVTLCSGSLGSNPANDLVDIIRSLKGRIHFAHLRNLRHEAPGRFEEAAHLSSDGSFDMYALVKALYDSGFDGPVSPDHGRMIWDEKGMPGYGLYDRALGCAYLSGLWEAVSKSAGDRRGS
jgi:mannonate dehydratase